MAAPQPRPEHRITPEWGPTDLATFAAVIVAWTLAVGLAILTGVGHFDSPYSDLAIGGAVTLTAWVIAARRYRSVMIRMDRLDDAVIEAVEGARRAGYSGAVRNIFEDQEASVTILPSARRPGA